MRRSIYVLAAAAALGLAAPVGAQTGAPRAAVELAPGEIALHIGAQGAAPADYATFEVPLVGRSKTRAEAEAALREQQRTTVTALEEMGIDRSALMLGEPSVRQSREYDWEGVSAAADAAGDAAEAAAIEAAADAVEDAAADAVEAAANEDAEAVDVLDILTGDVPRVTFWNATSTLTVTVDDLAKLEGVMQLLRSEESITSLRPKYRFRDEAKSEREAVAAAIAEARADAEIHADALGYRVVRIVAVSNDGPRMSLPSVLQAMATIDSPAREWSLAAQKIATVGVDFVIAPK